MSDLSAGLAGSVKGGPAGPAEGCPKGSLDMVLTGPLLAPAAVYPHQVCTKNRPFGLSRIGASGLLPLRGVGWPGGGRARRPAYSSPTAGPDRDTLEQSFSRLPSRADFFVASRPCRHRGLAWLYACLQTTVTDRCRGSSAFVDLVRTPREAVPSTPRERSDTIRLQDQQLNNRTRRTTCSSSTRSHTSFMSYDRPARTRNAGRPPAPAPPRAPIARRRFCFFLNLFFPSPTLPAPFHHHTTTLPAPTQLTSGH
jgi:hypothetical protein